MFVRLARMVFGTTKENVKLAHPLVRHAALPPSLARLVLAVITSRKTTRVPTVLRKTNVTFTTWPLV